MDTQPSWAAGQRILAVTLNEMLSDVGFVEDLTARTTTSTTYADASGGALTLSAVAPIAGSLMATLCARVDQAASINVLSSYTLTGSVSGVLYAASDIRACQWANSSSAGPFSAVLKATGWQPGETVTMQAQHRIASAGTGNIRYRSLALEALNA